MRCRDGKALLAAYADGQLAPEPAAGLAAHLAACAACRSLLERERQTRRLLALAANTEWTPPDLRLRIARAVDKPLQRGRLRAPIALGTLLGAAALSLGLLHGGLGSFQAAAPGVTAHTAQSEQPGSRAAAIPNAHPGSRFDPLLAERTLAYGGTRTISYSPLPPDWPADDRQTAVYGSKGGEAHPARSTSHYTLLAY